MLHRYGAASFCFLFAEMKINPNLFCISFGLHYLCTCKRKTHEFKEQHIQVLGADIGGYFGHHGVLFLVFPLSLHTSG